jgi:regulator of protease activity HflC (stomatin/prohibitin superfamily)
MPVNTSPIFISTGTFTPARIAAANTASDGSGSLVTLVTAAVDGTRVDSVRFRNAQASNAASSAMVHRMFLSNTGGTNFRLIGEVATPAATRSASAIGATSVYTFDQPIIMKSGQILSVCQSVYAGVQDQVDAVAYAGDYTG